MNLGIHVSSVGGLENVVKRGVKYGVNTIQMIPIGISSRKVSELNLLAFINELTDSPIRKVILNAVYINNIPYGNEGSFYLKTETLHTCLDFVERAVKLIEDRDIETEMVGACFYPFAHGDVHYDESLEKVSSTIQTVLDTVGGNQKILVETTACIKRTFGSKFSDLKNIRESIKDKDRVGFVIDTQHTFASGYDWVNDFDGVIDAIDKELGFENVKAIHLNDSKTELGSRRDLHEYIGKGRIGKKTLTKILRYEKFRDIPFILESPALVEEEATFKEVAKMKKWAGEI